MTAKIQFGSKQIDFCLEYSNRKSLGITVTPDLNVLVRAPVDTPLEKVKEKLTKKAFTQELQQNIQEKLDEVKDRILKVSGETPIGSPETPEEAYICGRFDGLMVAFHIICGLPDYPYPEDMPDIPEGTNDS